MEGEGVVDVDGTSFGGGEGGVVSCGGGGS